jgi:hypothetical protein
LWQRVVPQPPSLTPLASLQELEVQPAGHALTGLGRDPLGVTPGRTEGELCRKRMNKGIGEQPIVARKPVLVARSTAGGRAEAGPGIPCAGNETRGPLELGGVGAPAGSVVGPRSTGFPGFRDYAVGAFTTCVAALLRYSVA